MRKIRTVRVDDLTGEELSGDNAVPSISLSVNNRDYTLDLSAANAAEFFQLIKPYTDAATPAGGSGRTVRPKAARRSSETAVVRKWAEERGLISQGGRGRLPGAVWDAYRGRVN